MDSIKLTSLLPLAYLLNVPFGDIPRVLPSRPLSYGGQELRKKRERKRQQRKAKDRNR